jgi:hypothetical protein
MEQGEIKRPPTRNIYHLTYENACKVIDFINRNDTGALDSDYANISVGRVHTQVNDKNWQAVVDFLNNLDVRYEVMDKDDRNCIAKSNGHRKIDEGVLKPEFFIHHHPNVTGEQLNSVIDGCKKFHVWLKTQRARDILSNKKRKDYFIDNNNLMERCKKELYKMKHS